MATGVLDEVERGIGRDVPESSFAENWIHNFVTVGVLKGMGYFQGKAGNELKRGKDILSGKLTQALKDKIAILEKTNDINAINLDIKFSIHIKINAINFVCHGINIINDISVNIVNIIIIKSFRSFVVSFLCHY